MLYCRSGSSFTGEVISSGPSAMYIYEPFFRNKLFYYNSSFVEMMLNGLFNCDQPLIKSLPKMHSHLNHHTGQDLYLHKLLLIYLFGALYA